MLTIHRETQGNVEIIHPRGRIDGFTAPQLEDALQTALKEHRFRIVVDFADTEFLSSAGMRALLHARQGAQERGKGDVRLANMSKFLTDAFELVGFHKLFKIYPDRTAAVKSF